MDDAVIAPAYPLSMGEQDTDDPPTEYAPTELGDVVEDITAWSLVEDEPEPRWWTPARITAAGVCAALVAVGGAAAVAIPHLGQRTVGDVAMTTPSFSAQKPVVPEHGPSGFEVPPPPPPPTVTVTAPVPTHAPIDNSPLPPPLWSAAHDREFVATLQHNGWSIWDPAAMANNAHFVCSWLRAGDTPARAQSRLLDISRDEAWQITRTAMAVYPNCP